MSKYKYLVIDIDQDWTRIGQDWELDYISQEELNRAGSQGWELVGMTFDDDSHLVVAVFKRVVCH